MEELLNEQEDQQPEENAGMDDAFARLQQEQNALRFSAVSTGSFFWYGLLYAIPVIGWVICAVSAFAVKNISLRNFARATLIRIALGVLAVGLAAYFAVQLAGSLLLGLLSIFTGTDMEDMEHMSNQIGSVQQEMQDGKYEDFLDQVGGEHPELENVLGSIQQGGMSGLVDQLKGDDLKNVVDKYINGDYNQLFERLENGEFGDLGALGELYMAISAGFKGEDADYVEALYAAVTEGKPMEGMPKAGLAMLHSIYRTLPAEHKQMLSDAMEDYRVLGYKRVLEKYTNGDYDALLDDFKSGKYGDFSSLVERIMKLYILGGF